MKRKTNILSPQRQMETNKPFDFKNKTPQTYLEIAILVSTDFTDPIQTELKAIFTAFNENEAIQMAAHWLYKNSPLNIKTPIGCFVRNVINKHNTLETLNDDPMCHWIGCFFLSETKQVVEQ